MKLKLLPLLGALMLTTIFISTKGTGTEANCKLTCLPAATAVQPKKVEIKEPAAEYPFALAPGSYMFRY